MRKLAQADIWARSTATGTVAGHEAASNPHPQYQLTSALSEAVDDRVAALLVAGANVTLTYNDVANTLTVAASGGGGGSGNGYFPQGW